MATAQQAFKTAYAIVRKHAASLLDDSFDANRWGTDEEAMRQRSARLVAHELGLSTIAPMPQLHYLAALAAADVVLIRQPRVQRTVQERLDYNRDTEIYIYT